MSFTDINIKKQGFTIVELLIVVVVIAILAAITIVSYNGITNRANASAAESLASGALKKAEAYNAEESRYPLTTAELTGAAASKSYQTPTATFVDGSTTNGAVSTTNGKNTVRLWICAPSATAIANVTSTTISGIRIQYWDYDASTPAAAFMNSGNIGATNGSNCFTPTT